jgi:hypothetical protein
MLKLRSIEESCLEAAATLLTEGFPSHSLAFWQRGLRRVADHTRAMGEASIGTFLMAQDKPVGILLTIPRHDAVTGRRILNLSSWYVEETHRWSATRLMIAAMGDKTAIYTDLTPSKAAADVNVRFGFRSFDVKEVVLALPWTAIVGRRQGKLTSLDAVPPGAIPQALMQDLQKHRELGCIVTVVATAGRYYPIVFDVISRKHIPTARIIFVDNIDLVMDNLAALSRMLILRGVPLLTLRVDEDTSLPHAVVLRRGFCYQVKGDWDDRMINELYSERVLLKV